MSDILGKPVWREVWLTSWDDAENQENTTTSSSVRFQVGDYIEDIVFHQVEEQVRKIVMPQLFAELLNQ